MHTAITERLDDLEDHIKLNVSSHPFNVHLFLILVNVMFSSYPLIAYFQLKRDIHVAFWLGESITMVPLCVPLLLLVLNFGVLGIQCSKPRAPAVKIMCFWALLFSGVVLLAAGAFVWVQCRQVARNLSYHCGQDKLSAAVQEEWLSLVHFYQACMKIPGIRVDFIVQCPNFEQEFSANPLAEYIEDMEFEYSCMGFCEHWPRALFNMDSVHDYRCATAIANMARSVSLMAAVPIIFVGGVLLTVGTLLSHYDHI